MVPQVEEAKDNEWQFVLMAKRVQKHTELNSVMVQFS